MAISSTIPNALSGGRNYPATLRYVCVTMQSALKVFSVFWRARFSLGQDAMDKPAQNIQDSFLNNARKEKGVITIYLLSGVKLSGRIKSFDKYSLVLETNNQEQLIFK